MVYCKAINEDVKYSEEFEWPACTHCRDQIFKFDFETLNAPITLCYSPRVKFNVAIDFMFVREGMYVYI